MILEERIKRIDENTLDYDFTIEDPMSWDDSWSARFPLRRIEDQFMSTHAMKVITVWLVYLPDGAGMRQWG